MTGDDEAPATWCDLDAGDEPPPVGDEGGADLDRTTLRLTASLLLRETIKNVRHEVREQAPSRARQLTRRQKEDRAATLAAEGHSVPRIAQLMTAEGLLRGTTDPGRSVRRWLAGAKSRTERDLSG